MNSGRLEGVSIERPCPKRWSELVGDERRRYCSACALHVTNLSALTRAEAEGFLAASRGRVCVTYLPAPDGGVSLRSETRVARHLTRHLSRVASFLLGLLFLLPGCRPAAGRPDSAGDAPDPDDARHDDTRLLGTVREDPVCQAGEDERMILGEMVAPDLRPPLPPMPEREPERK